MLKHWQWHNEHVKSECNLSVIELSRCLYVNSSFSSASASMIRSFCMCVTFVWSVWFRRKLDNWGLCVFNLAFLNRFLFGWKTLEYFLKYTITCDPKVWIGSFDLCKFSSYTLCQTKWAPEFWLLLIKEEQEALIYLILSTGLPKLGCPTLFDINCM